jgi:hypothetical protein
MIEEGYSPSFVVNNRSFPLPIKLMASMCLLGTFPIAFPLHKGTPSLLYSPLMVSLYHYQFLSSKHQVASLYRSSLDSGLLCFRVIKNILDEITILFKEISSISSLLHVVPSNASVQCAILLCASSPVPPHLSSNVFHLWPLLLPIPNWDPCDFSQTLPTFLGFIILKNKTFGCPYCQVIQLAFMLGRCYILCIYV